MTASSININKNIPTTSNNNNNNNNSNNNNNNNNELTEFDKEEIEIFKKDFNNNNNNSNTDILLSKLRGDYIDNDDDNDDNDFGPKPMIQPKDYTEDKKVNLYYYLYFFILKYIIQSLTMYIIHVYSYI
jgi:hypothetical protein